MSEDEIVISGIGGRFPEADNLVDLSEKLFNGTDFLSLDPRKLTKGFYENLPERNGKLTSEVTLFDYTYFGISKAVASAMDSMICQLLERTFEALIDAGINPSDLRGTDSSVFTGTCHSDSDLEWSSNMKVGYGIMGRNRCMNSNRISYWLDLNGTSYSMDSGWANGISTLYQGWNAIKTGKSDTAIVGVCSLQNIALPTIQLKDFGVLSPDGYTRSFDDSANGWGRSSAVVVLVLQRASIAKRCYATIGHVSSTVLSNNSKVISQSSQKDWESMLRDFYAKSKIDPNDIYYVEAHGSGIKEEDAAELNALEDVFCKNRKTPLLIGCVKSNMGHCESSSSFCGLVKSVIALQKGMIPANLHYEKPNSSCPGLSKGVLKVVNENTPLPPDAWVAINSHSFGGTYGHVVLKPFMKNKVIKDDGIPRLVLLADRTNDYMANLFEKVESTPYDPEYVGLLHEIYSKKVERYFGRGYTILPKPENPIHENQIYGEEKRPLWFIFSGMGSQWPGMARRLMDLPLFRESIERSHKVLESKGLDLIKIVTGDDPNVFDNILNSFVGIAAVQIAIIDILKALKITPDGMIGHSVGELGCSYADDCFTAEQMILAAYYRGRASKEAELIQGSMAAVGKQYKDIKDQLPEDVDIACHNSDDNCTLSGPADSINNFVARLKEGGVFAKAVNVSNIAYHSRYIKPAAPTLLKYLKELVPEPKLRSAKWISTSNPEDKWDTETARYCSAEYHTNNLLSCVLFQEGSKHIPKNAICIEIAPHGLLQAILKRSLGDEVTNIPLTSRFSADPLIFFLQALGKVYMAGVDFSVMNLYPKIDFPVSRGTQFLNNLPHWHEQKLSPIVTPIGNKIVHSLKKYILSESRDGIGVIINEKNKYPLSTFVGLLWELCASQNKLNASQCPIIIRNFTLNDFVDINLSEDDNKTIYFLNGLGGFEIVETDGQILGNGTISTIKEKPLLVTDKTLLKPDLVGGQIYHELKRKGYAFGKHFETLTAVSYGENEILAEIPVTSTWSQVIESMIQVHILRTDDSSNFLLVPFKFHELEISSLMHTQQRDTLGQNAKLLVTYDFLTNTVTCGGLTLKRLEYTQIPKIMTNFNFKPIDFYPFVNPSLQNVLSFADYCFGIMISNLDSAKTFCGINILEVVDKQRPLSIGDHLKSLHGDIEMVVETVPRAEPGSRRKETMELVICPAACVDSCANFVVEDGFMLVRGPASNVKFPHEVVLIAKFVDDLKQEYLFLKKTKAVEEEFEFIMMDEETENSLTSKLRELNISKKVRYLLTKKKPAEGIKEFQLKVQAKTVVPLRWMFVLDPKAPSFDPQLEFYSEQLKKGLLTNVYINGNWGQFYEYSLSDSNESKLNFKLDDNSDLTPSYLSFEPSANIVKLDQVEFSGKLNGSKVMGISQLLNHRRVVLDKNLTWKIPESWTLEDGATVPAPYALAYYCLFVLAELQPSQKVLVVDGLTYIGQAFIAVALSHGCQVFLSASDDEEKTTIRKLFPQIEEAHILDHNAPTCKTSWDIVGEENAVDVIVTMLDGPRFFSAIRTVAEFGNIFHFGKEDLRKNTQMGTYLFLKTTSFYSVSPEVISRLPETDKQALHQLVAEGLKKGAVKPLPRMTTTVERVEALQSKLTGDQTRFKSLLEIKASNPKSIKFDSDCSYLVLGDETDLWVDVVEWLTSRKITKVVVGRRDVTQRGALHCLFLKKHKKLIVRDHQNVENLLSEARNLGPLSAVVYLSMNTTDELDVLKDLDKLYLDPKAHFLAISRSQGCLSEICSRRNESGFPSTNYIWKGDTIEVNANLEYMARLNGRNAVVNVTPPARCSTVDHKLSELLPSSIDDFCNLGSSVRDHVEIVPLNTLAGCRLDSFHEIAPYIIIPGLQSEPVATLQASFSKLLYPAACVKIPDLNLSIKQMVTFILPEIVRYNNSHYYNIIGISWGSNLAMELTKRLEEIGETVGLILIEGPVLNAESLVTESLESDLLNFIQGKFKTSVDFKAENQMLDTVSWQGKLNTVLSGLNLPQEKEDDFRRGANFVYNSMKSLLEHDVTTGKFEGPFTVIVSGQRQFDDKVFSRICSSISIRCLPTEPDKLMETKEFWSIIHGSAISQPMSKATVHECSWPALEDYVNQKDKVASYQNISSYNLKFSFSC